MSNTVAVQAPSDMIRSYRADFAQVLPSHIKPDTWVRLAVGALNRNADLKEAATSDPGSLMVALLDAARMGLEPGTEQYYLTSRKVKGRPTVLGISGYQGEIELMYRAGAVSSVIVEPVYANDGFTYRPGRDDRPQHDIDWDAEDRGAIRLAYAYAVMKDGAISKVVVVNKARIERAKKASSSAGSSYSPWTSDETAMWMKTAAHDLKKWVPTSAEYIREQLRAVRDVEAEGPKVVAPQPVPQTPVADDVIDGEVIDLGDTPEEPWK